MKVFDNDDLKYFDWITVNPDGYVLNTRRTSTLNFTVLHKGHCHCMLPRTSVI
jgi:hypothetical protein